MKNEINEEFKRILITKSQEKLPFPISTNVGTPNTTASTPPPRNLFVVDHANSPDSPRQQNDLCGRLPCRKPLFCFLFIYGILVTGFGTYLFNKFLGIPSLNGQIDALKKEIDRLEVQIDELSGEIDELDETTEKLENTINDLNDENNVTTDLMQQFNESLVEYKSLNSQLERENEEYKDNNENLDVAVTRLESTVSNLTVERINLNSTVNEYKMINDALNVEINSLNSLTDELNGTVTDLDRSIEEFKYQNERFRKSNEDLGTLVSFLNTTVTDSTATFAELVELVAADIRTSRTLVKNRLKYMLVTLSSQNWVCSIQTIFGLEPFMVNSSMPIGETSYNRVIEFIDDSTMSYFCVELSDFEQFIRTQVLMSNETDVWNVNIADLISGVQVYLFDIYEYYFARETVGGLTDEMWADFEYDCKNIPPDLTYKYPPGLVLP